MITHIEWYHSAYAFIDLADCVVRTIPAEDLTNGFFVSCFVRKGQDDNVKRPIDKVDAVSETNSPKKKKKNSKKKKTALTA